MVNLGANQLRRLSPSVPPFQSRRFTLTPVSSTATPTPLPVQPVPFNVDGHRLLAPTVCGYNVARWEALTAAQPAQVKVTGASFEMNLTIGLLPSVSIDRPGSVATMPLALRSMSLTPPRRPSTL